MRNAVSILNMKRLNPRYKSRPATIYCRITVNGRRAGGDTSTFMQVLPEHWNARTQQATANTVEAQDINTRLSHIRNTLNGLVLDLEMKNRHVTANLLKTLYKNNGRAEFTILQLSGMFLEHQQKLVGIDLAVNTYRTYCARQSRLAFFLESKKRKGLLCVEFTPKVAQEYVYHLKTERKAEHNHIRKVIHYVKQVLRFGVEMELLDRSPMEHYRLKGEKAKPIVYMSEAEIHLLENYRFASQRLTEVSDLFLLQCYTGLAYVDVARLTKDHISKGVDNELWIHINRKKVDSAQCSIPVLPQAKRILEKYRYELPMISNQKFNAYLKEVTDITGIRKRLTTHVGRKTFAMLLLNKNVPIETVSRILGHASVKVTQKHYAFVLDQKISADIQPLRFVS